MIDYERLRMTKLGAERDDVLDQMLAEYGPDNPPCLSDSFVYDGMGGVSVRERLEEQEKTALSTGSEPFRWRLRALKDERGNPLKPGDKVSVRDVKKLQDRHGRPIPGHEIDAAKQAGNYEEKYTTLREFPIDADGCITCTYTMAARFISLYGVHPKTSAFLSVRYQKIDGTGNHYDRFQEVLPGSIKIQSRKDR